MGFKHPTKIPHYDTLAELAEKVGDLRYDALALFLAELSGKIHRDSLADYDRGRPQLSKSLSKVSHQLSQLSFEVNKTWAICARHTAGLPELDP